MKQLTRKEIEKRIAAQFRPERYFTIQEMSERLQVSRIRIYQLILSHKLLKVKIGKYSYVKVNNGIKK